jgi:hypothetical protein
MDENGSKNETGVVPNETGLSFSAPKIPLGAGLKVGTVLPQPV